MPNDILPRPIYELVGHFPGEAPETSWIETLTTRERVDAHVEKTRSEYPKARFTLKITWRRENGEFHRQETVDYPPKNMEEKELETPAPLPQGKDVEKKRPRKTRTKG